MFGIGGACEIPGVLADVRSLFVGCEKGVPGRLTSTQEISFAGVYTSTIANALFSSPLAARRRLGVASD
jgi:hypothetical protein